MLPITAIVEQVQNTRVWLFIKGIFLLFLAALVALDVFSVWVLMVLLAIFAIVSGIATIIMGLANKMAHVHYAMCAVVTGMISLVLGVLFFIWPSFSIQFWVIFYLLGLMLDGLLIACAMLSVKVMGASKWWAIGGGLAVFFLGLTFVFRVAVFDPAVLSQIGALAMTFTAPSTVVLMVWRHIGNDLAMYLFISSIFFFVTVMVINPKNIVRSIVKKTGKSIESSVKKVAKGVQKSARKVERKAEKATKNVQKTAKKAVKNVKKTMKKAR